MKIGIMGNYGATNIGDDAILTSILKDLHNHEIIIFSSNPEETDKTYDANVTSLFPLGIRSFIRYGFSYSIKALKDVDVIIFGGGGLMQDDYLFACFLWAWQIFWVKILKKPYFIYATGVGPLRTSIGKKLTKWVYENSKEITVRDNYSAEVLQGFGTQKSINITSDPAFLYRINEEIIPEREKGKVLISLRPWKKYNAKTISSFISFLTKMKEEKNVRFVFASMQSICEADMKIINPIIKKLGGEIFIPKNFSELIQNMQTAEFAIGMRYHFLIASIITQTPCLPISYSPKIDELYSGTPLEKYQLSVANLDPDYLYEAMKRVSIDYNNIKVYQKARLSVLRDLSEKNVLLFDKFLKTFDQNQITC